MHSFITLTVATAFTALTAAVPHARNHYNLHTVRDSIEALVLKGAPIAGREVPVTHNLSPIGACGGSSGYDCGPGFCCSKWGYCGTSEAYCGAGGETNSTGTSSGKSWPGHHRRPHHKKPHHGKPAPTYSSPPSYSSPAGSASAAPAPSSAPAPAPSSAAPAPSSAPAYSAPAPSASAPSGGSSGGFSGYKMYTGDGSASAGWPSESEWMDFDSAFEATTPNLKVSCTQFGFQDNSDEEIADLKSSIQSVSASSGVDSRFILAIVMQESNGCVRVQTTDNGVRNPGLMQDHDGQGSCNNGTPQVPCPASEITLMIQEGVEGTKAGAGLKQCMDQCSTSGSQEYYQAAVIYNSGNLPPNLDDNTATPCYASDVANRLMGWVTGTSSCTL